MDEDHIDIHFSGEPVLVDYLGDFVFCIDVPKNWP